MAETIFVVHEHHASQLHYDFRLEIGGVLKSWAIPKGPSMNPADRRLAILVDDHALEYRNFEGIIPQGCYGAGAVAIWDSGVFEPLEENAESGVKRGRLVFRLKGKRLRGAFTLVRLKGRAGGRQWLLIKKQDSAADPQWKLDLALTAALKRRLRGKILPCGVS
jgi:bifunctional non-homologous end joining protein LigD